MNYALYNKIGKVYLEHPKVGLWFTENEQEAQDMLKVCREYILTTNSSWLANEIVIFPFKSVDELHTAS
jgi:hypothetical protein